jgi:hypothetical protein
MKTEHKKTSNSHGWIAQSWEYLSEAAEIPIKVTEATSADCLTFEKKAAQISADAGSDWLISTYCTDQNGDPLILTRAASMELSLTDKISLLQIIKCQDNLRIEPLDNRSSLLTKTFLIVSPDCQDGFRLTCGDPAFNFRTADYENVADTIFSLVENNVTVASSEHGIEEVKLKDYDLARLPYYVLDISVRHYSQLLSRVPKKKKLQKLLDG